MKRKFLAIIMAMVMALSLSVTGICGHKCCG